MLIEPMKATPIALVPEDLDYLCEAKYDGWRGFFRRDPSVVNGAGFFSATWKAIHTIPYIVDVLADLPEGTILDGEIVNLSGDRQWNLAQKVCSRSKVHIPSAAEPALTYVVFDVLELKGIRLMDEKLEDRKKVLEALFARGVPDNVQVIEGLACEQATFDKLTAEGWEGVVCKKRDSYYVPGARNNDWLKCKAETEVDVEITGFFPPTPGSKYAGNAVGGFLFEYEGVEGRCGTGMDNSLREEMLTNGAKFLNTVAVVAHGGIGETGKLRFPTLKRLRDPADKGPKQLKMQASNGAWVERALTAEEERDDYKGKYEDAQARVQGLLKSLKPARGNGVPGERKTRNYNSMDNDKLLDAIQSLDDQRGEGWEKALETERNGGWNTHRHRAEAKKVANKRGLVI